MAAEESDLVLRTSNDDANRAVATTWLGLEDMEEIIRKRFDANAWDVLDEDLKVRAMIAAYHDIDRLAWSNYGGESQSKDYEFNMRFGDTNDPPIEDARFILAVKRAQAAQTMFYVRGTTIREMARDGIRMTLALSGSEMEFTGFRGAVCAEAREILGKWVEWNPRMRRMR